MDMTGRWLEILVSRVNTADLAIIACIVGFIFFMKYNQHEARNKANLVVATVMGVGFLILVVYRVL